MEGLSSSTCMEIFQDTEGFLWFGTIDGLNKYNGYEFETFRPEPENPYSISSNRINAIVEDNQGFLWIATSNGLSIYDKYSEKFHKVDLGLSTDYETQNSIFINTLLFSEVDNSVWVGTRNGKFHIKKNCEFQFSIPVIECLKINFFNKNRKGLASDINVVGIESYQDEIFFLNQENYLSIYNTGTSKFRNITIPLSNEEWLDHLPKKMLITNEGDFWMGNNLSNLFIWSPKEQSLHEISPAKDNIPIFDIYQDRNGQVWISTDGHGLYLINKQGKLLQHFKSDPGNPFSIANNQPSKVLEDRDGIFWIATYNKGVNKLNPSKSAFGHYFYQSGRKNGLSSKIAQSVLEDSKGRIWIGTDGGGLNLFDEASDSYRHFRNEPNDLNSLSSDKILYLSEANDGGIWVSTWDGGLSYFNPGTEKFKRFTYDPNNSYSIGQNTVWCAVQDSMGRVWLGTQTAGLNVFNPQSEQFYQYTNTSAEENSLISDFVFSLFIDSKDRLFVGTAQGLQYVNLNSLKEYIPDKILFHEIEGINNNRINYITEDSHGRIWIGSDLGLYELNANLNLLHSYTTQNGLPNNLVVGIKEDLQGNIWITTKGGLSYLNTQTNRLQNFNVHDGIQGLEFQSKSIERTSGGLIIAGGINGFNMFNPKEISVHQELYEPIINNISFFNKRVRVGDTIGGRVILDRPLINSGGLKLKYDENYLTFEYVALNFENPERVRYQYLLEGLDEAYISAGKNRLASYSNLQPGNYEFKVMAAIDGNWENAKTTSLPFSISTPPWLTWWAYLIYCILALSLIFVFFYYYTILIRRNKERELDHMKMKFFTNVSHEFRTPLTLILNPVDKILSSYTDPDQVKKSAVTIQRSARRLLHLINQLLDFRKIDEGGDPLQVSRIDIVRFSRDVFELFRAIGEEKGICLKFYSSYSEYEMYFDPDKYEKILTNLISNALKFTSSGGSVNLNIERTSQETGLSAVLMGAPKIKEFIKIVVADTGIGFQKEHLNEVFSRFFNVDRTKTGTGIGLNFTKALVEMHGGSIDVKSEYKKGSRFIVNLPVQPVSKKFKRHAKNGDFGNYDLSEISKTILKAAEYELSITDNHSKEESIQESSNDCNKPVILIVEDNKELRTHLKNELEFDFIIKEARDGEIGYNKVQKFYPDLVISDVMMPKKDGFELCRLIKTDIDICHIPVILLTARSLEEDRIEGFETGADEYLPKPFNIHVLRARIRNLLEAKKRLKAKFKSLSEVFPSKELTTNTLDEIFLDKSTKLVMENISDPDFSLEDIVNELGMGRSKFYRKINSITGQNPSHFIRTVRLKYAADLLRNSGHSIKEIAYMSGFNSSAYFSKTFKELFDITPTQFIKINSPQNKK
ncbi:hybrid sensor histidine kinase/response regulator transcription factor [Autumnicola psychrophila]|uniref:histidine kinase n=1 Tax=Autumnicola psychrophila TaxID=3075592 RepID=A0ABU3DMC4_9FLAO|nr:two-component regulator propeller domain-containing protein [Zunongwangia sp. F225]MDT0684748.1 two-component regulator propeller domain-containing protein [Zunongwangia sp. F225]